jgi:hypothetical protein
MDTDDLSEKAWALIVLAASVSDTLKTELGAMASRFRSEDEWLRGIRAHMERIAENPEGYVDYWNLENEEGVTPDRMARCAADLRRRVDEILVLPIKRRGPRA